MCDAAEQEKWKAMSAMLKWTDLSLLIREGHQCETFEQGVELLGTWFNLRDKRSRLLAGTKCMYPSSAMEVSPGESEFSVLRSFIARLMSWQHQFRDEYY